MIGKVLNKDSHSVIVTQDPIEAIETVKSDLSQVELVIVDEHDGWGSELYEKSRDVDKKVEFVFLVSQAQRTKQLKGVRRFFYSGGNCEDILEIVTELEAHHRG